MYTTPSLKFSLRTCPLSPFQVPLNFEPSCAINMNAAAPRVATAVNITFFKGVSPFSFRKFTKAYNLALCQNVSWRQNMANVKPVPEGYHTATPYLCCQGAAEALEFYKKAFGAVETVRMKGPDGKIAHAEIRIGDSHIMLSDEHRKWVCMVPSTTEDRQYP